MSHRIVQPVQSVRLTNVAIVRMNRHGKRFEIACYRNKVVNYRQGLETDLSEVLQTDRVFTNVSKGQFANSKDLLIGFETTDEDKVALHILEKGILQVSDLERSQEKEATTAKVSTWIATNCVHSTSNRPFTVTQIRDAMRQANFAMHPTRNIKRQYLDCIKLLQSSNMIPIQRAKMELCLFIKKEQEVTVMRELKELQNEHIVTFLPPIDNCETTNVSDCHVAVLVDPSLYRPIDAIVKRMQGRLEILRQVVTQEGDANIDVEMKRKEVQTNNNNAIASTVEHHLAQEMQESLCIADHNEKDALVGEGKGDPNSYKAKANSNDDDEHSKPGPAPLKVSHRKNQKIAQKQSKKAKRREKEETAERQARIDAEQQRQEERMAGQKPLPEKQGQHNASGEKLQLKSCNTCGGEFSSSALYRAHFRSDWHRYNIKLQMKSVAPVSEREFLLCDSDAFFNC